MITTGQLATIPLFASLGQKELDYLARSVEDIRLVAGEYVSHEGDDRALFAVVEGQAEITKVVNGVERVIATRLPGQLIGEIPMIIGSPLPASCRATEPSRIVKLSVTVFHTLAMMAPQVSEAVGAAALQLTPFLAEIAAERPAAAICVVGPPLDPKVHAVKTFLHRNQLQFESFAPADADLAQRLGEPSTVSGPYPVVLMPDGTRLIAPTMREIATASGLAVTPEHADYDVVIVGGGPAGLTAAVNASSEGLRTVVIERFAPGGQAGTSTRIENYPGFPFGVSGDDLASRTLKQAKRLGAEVVVTRHVESVDPTARTVTLDGGDVLSTKSVFLAMGVDWRRIENESLDRFIGSGVYYGAARSDAGLAYDKDVYLIGGGNSAGQAALFFSAHARSVTLLVRGESLASSMSQYLIDQIATKPNVSIETRCEVVAAHGGEQLDAIEVIDRRTDTTTRRDGAALFVMIGADAATDWLPGDVARDRNGFVLTGSDLQQRGIWTHERDPFPLETSAPGVFAVGDVRSGSVKRVAAAVGEGGVAIAFVHRYLQATA